MYIRTVEFYRYHMAESIVESSFFAVFFISSFMGNPNPNPNPKKTFA
jgi:hypothetical protein